MRTGNILKGKILNGSKITMTPKTSISSLLALVRNIIYLTLALFSKLSFQKEIVILMYHSVDWTNDFHHVDPGEFRRQIDYLKKNYAIVSLTEMVDFVKKKKKIPRKSVAITFDDGYQDLYLNVYSYICRSNLPATVFVTTGYIGKEWPLTSNHARMLTWKEIEAMSKNNIEVGAHTVTHPNLQEKSLEEAKNEILESKKVIEEHIKKSVNYFSYPFGKYTPEIVDITKSLGFKGGVGGGGTIRSDTHPFTLNRIQVDSSVSFILFKARLTKAVDWSKTLEQVTQKVLKKSSVRAFYFSNGQR